MSRLLEWRSKSVRHGVARLIVSSFAGGRECLELEAETSHSFALSMEADETDSYVTNESVETITETGRLSADSVQSLLEKHVRAAHKSCPSLKAKSVSPHVLRHSAIYVYPSPHQPEQGMIGPTTQPVLWRQSRRRRQQRIDLRVAIGISDPTSDRSAAIRDISMLQMFAQAESTVFWLSHGSELANFRTASGHSPRASAYLIGRALADRCCRVILLSSSRRPIVLTLRLAPWRSCPEENAGRVARRIRLTRPADDPSAARGRHT